MNKTTKQLYYGIFERILAAYSNGDYRGVKVWCNFALQNAKSCDEHWLSVIHVIMSHASHLLHESNNKSQAVRISSFSYDRYQSNMKIMMCQCDLSQKIIECVDIAYSLFRMDIIDLEAYAIDTIARVILQAENKTAVFNAIQDRDSCRVVGSSKWD